MHAQTTEGKKVLRDIPTLKTPDGKYSDFKLELKVCNEP